MAADGVDLMSPARDRERVAERLVGDAPPGTLLPRSVDAATRALTDVFPSERQRPRSRALAARDAEQRGTSRPRWRAVVSGHRGVPTAASRRPPATDPQRSAARRWPCRWRRPERHSDVWRVVAGRLAQKECAGAGPRRHRRRLVRERPAQSTSPVVPPAQTRVPGFAWPVVPTPHDRPRTAT